MLDIKYARFFFTMVTAGLMGSLSFATTELPLRRSALEPGQGLVGLGASYLKTKASYGDGGERNRLLSNGELTSATGVLFGEYGLLQGFSLLANLELVANSLSVSSTPAVSNASSGLGDAQLGARFMSATTPIRISGDAFVQLPLYTRLSAADWSTLSTNSPVPLGNGATVFGLFGEAELPLSGDFSAGAGLGYTARSAGFSNVMPYRFYAKFDEKRGLFARLGFSGQITVGEDIYTGTNNNERGRAVIAGSQRYNAMNPTAFSLDLMFGTYIGQTFFVNAGAMIPLSGKNTPIETTYALAVGFDLGAKKETEYTKSNRGFQQYTFASRVLQSNNKLRQVLIDKGRNDGVKIGEFMDIFEPDTSAGAFGDTVARGRVTEAGPTRSKIQLKEHYKQIRVEEGFVVRRPVR